MATYNKFDQFVEDLARKVHNLNADTLRLALSNTAPTSGLLTLSQITQISSAGGYTPGAIASSGATQTGGVLKLTGLDVSFLAVAVPFDAFRYVVLYNDTPTSPADPLIGWWDRGASLIIQAAETFIADLDQVNGILTVT